MRLSANESSPYFDAERVFEATVLVDGDEVRFCLEASEEEGWADVVATDENGVVLVEGDELVHKRLTGAVEIRFL